MEKTTPEHFSNRNEKQDAPRQSTRINTAPPHAKLARRTTKAVSATYLSRQQEWTSQIGHHEDNDAWR